DRRQEQIVDRQLIEGGECNIPRCIEAAGAERSQRSECGRAVGGEERIGPEAVRLQALAAPRRDLLHAEVARPDVVVPPAQSGALGGLLTAEQTLALIAQRQWSRNHHDVFMAHSKKMLDAAAGGIAIFHGDGIGAEAVWNAVEKNDRDAGFENAG